MPKSMLAQNVVCRSNTLASRRPSLRADDSITYPVRASQFDLKIDKEEQTVSNKSGTCRVSPDSSKYTAPQAQIEQQPAIELIPEAFVSIDQVFGKDR